MVVRWGRVSRLMVNPQRHPKTGVYRLRQAVPEALRQPLATLLGRDKPVRELIRSLGTRDPQEAKGLMRDAMQWADGLLSAARNGARPLSDRDAHALAGIWYRRRVAEWEADPGAADQWTDWDVAMPTSPGTISLYADSGPEDVADPAFDRAWDAFLRPFITEAEALLAAEGITTDQVGKQRLAGLLTQRLGQALAQHQRKRRGDYRPDRLPAEFPALERRPASPVPTPDTATPFVSIRDLFARWKTVAVVKPRTVEETEYAMEALITFLGHDDASLLTRADLARWRDAQKAAGLTNNTWNNRLSMLAQPLRFAVTEGKLTADPTLDLRLAKSRVKSPPPYSDADAVLLLAAARNETRPSYRWAHWVMAFTGMRAGEVLQLTGGDVRNDDGIWYIHVHEDDADKSVKTGVRRNVPIHHALIAEGFVRYAQTIARDAPVFPDKLPDKHGNRGGRAWNVVGKWAREFVTDPRYAPDHSWRHRFIDRMRRAGVPKPLREAIVGHAGTSTEAGYGEEGEALRVLSVALNKVPSPIPPPENPPGSP